VRKCGLRSSRFEQLDGVAGGVVHQDLLAPDAGDNVIAKVNTRLTEALDGRLDVGDF
jgi:hypothetical protein